MSTFFVDFINGLDANNGLGPDASHASNKPWKTIAKLLGAAGMASGDTAYLSPAGQFRETVTVAMTSATVETFVLGDPGNAQGFKTSGGVLVAQGDVIISAYTTNDTTAPAASATLNLSGRDFLTFQNLTIVGGDATTSCIQATTTNSVNIKLLDLTLLPGRPNGVLITYTGLADVASNWTIDRCRMLDVAANVMTITLPTSASADYDSNFLIQNCLIVNNVGDAIGILSSGAAAFKAGGVDVLDCTIISRNGVTTGANIATSIPCTVNGCTIMSGNVGLTAATAGQITEDKNRIFCATARTSVTAGGSSQAGTAYAMLLDIGQWMASGAMARPFLAPMASSPLLGFGTPSGPPAVDGWSRPRPAGGGSTVHAVGYLERHDTLAQETSVTQAGASSGKIVGPGDHDLHIPVDVNGTTISIYVRYDTNHGTGSKPQMILLANGSIGVVTETKTATVGVDTWEQLTFTPFTPTAKGYVTVRLVSRAAAGNGIAYFDTEAGGATSTSGFDYFRMGEPIRALVPAAAGGSGGMIVHPGTDGGMRG